MQHISTLDLKLKASNKTLTSTEMSSGMAPFLQGVLMEHIDSRYAALLHQQPFNPYSSYCEPVKSEKALHWRISTLTDEATEQLLTPLSAVDEIEVRAIGANLQIIERNLSALPLKDLTNKIHDNAPRRAKVRFVTPTSFKSAGRYVMIPTVRLIFQNLLMRYCQIYEHDKEIDPETIDYMEKNVRVISYNLRSQYFSNVMSGGRKVPAFVGSMSFAMDGPQMLVGLANMLLGFGEYSGVGIKTAMGMGGMQCL